MSGIANLLSEKLERRTLELDAAYRRIRELDATVGGLLAALQACLPRCTEGTPYRCAKLGGDGPESRLPCCMARAAIGRATAPVCVSSSEQDRATTGSTIQTVAPGPGSPPNPLPTPPCVEKG